MNITESLLCYNGYYIPDFTYQRSTLKILLIQSTFAYEHLYFHHSAPWPVESPTVILQTLASGKVHLDAASGPVVHVKINACLQ